MGLILNIDTSTEVCSVSLAKNGEILANKEDHSGNNHSKLLSVFIDTVFSDAGLQMHEIDAVSISKGPGSYTGLRIGTAMAKGICFGLGKPLIVIGTLQSMALGFINHNKNLLNGKELFCPMIDARRMEVYTAVYDYHLIVVKDTSAKIIDEKAFKNILKDKRLYFFGNGAEKCKTVLKNNSNAIFFPGFYASSKHMVTLSEIRFKTQYFADLAYFEPYYLKDFIATKPSKNIFS